MAGINRRQKSVVLGRPLIANELLDYQKGAIVSRVILKKDAGNVTVFAFDKGQGLSEHTAPFDAMVEIVDGQARVRIAGKAHILKKGQIIIMPANIPHSVHAVKRFKMVLTMVKK